MNAVVSQVRRSIAGRVNRFLSRPKARREKILQNRRRFQRFPCGLPVEVHLETPGHLSILNATARDISNGGMRVECATIPALMSACYVSFQIPEWGPFKAGYRKQVMAQARVQHCHPGGMSFGLAFLRPISAAYM